jgi:hypothetical protein
MYESIKKTISPKYSFYQRLIWSLSTAFIFLALSLGAGMWGYHYFEGMPWIDAFVNAAMILSGMGPVGQLNTYEGKLFAGIYALYSGLTFILIIGLVLAPWVHRAMHKFHAELEDKK